MMRLVWCALVLFALVGGWLCPSESLAQSGSACTKTKTNPLGSGTPRAPLTVSTTAITVALENTSRCTLLIVNTSDQAMTCIDATMDGVPTTTSGIPIAPGNSLSLDREGQGRWLCIRTGAADATAVVAEGLP